MVNARSVRLCVAAGALALILGTTAAAETLVFSNSPAPGDPLVFGQPSPDKELGTSSWFYSKVDNNGTVGVTTGNPRSGNGSVEFKLQATPPEDKSAIAYRPAVSLGLLANLESVTYDWYRATPKDTSTLDFVHPALRILLGLDGGGTTELIFERVYNSLPITVGTWENDKIDASTNLWITPGGPYNINLATWQTTLTGAVVKGFSVDAGEGWTGGVAIS